MSDQLLMHQKSQLIFRRAEQDVVTLVPQFLMNKMNVIADSFSRFSQVVGLEWSLNKQAFKDLLKRWPVMVDLFAISLYEKLPNYFSLVNDPMSLGRDAIFPPWDHPQVYVFLPFAVVKAVLNKLRMSTEVVITLLF